MQSPLEQWLNRKQSIPTRFYTFGTNDIISDDGRTSGWVGIQHVQPFYRADSLVWLSLKESRKKTKKYLSDAAKIINGLEGGWLDKEEVWMIKEELGEPPPLCLPIYLISIRDSKQFEELVYVGITRTEQRFAGGHSVAVKLTDPKFNNHLKLIYQCCVWLHLNDEYIAMEWLEPEGLAENFLHSVEAQLIYYFQPRFNTQKRKEYSAKLPLVIHVQNCIDDGFLNDIFIFPRKRD
jgi:hypothetical protein